MQTIKQTDGVERDRGADSADKWKQQDGQGGLPK